MKKRTSVRRFAATNVRSIFLLPAVLLAACVMSGGERLEEHACPPGGTQWTYENFGASFLARHCETCHAKNAAERNGAPENVTFDSRDDVVRWRDRIFDNAAAANTAMPPGPNDPPRNERDALADWLACGAL